MTTNKTYFGKNKNRKGTGFPAQRDMYGRQDTRVEYSLFGSDYFSNADVKIYFGDIYIEDATSIAMQLQEDVLPVYGYNSFTFDTVSRGKRIIQGALSINFKTVGYLHKVLENAHAIFYAIEEGKKKDLLAPNYYENLKLNEIMQKLGKRSFDQIADEYEKAIWGGEDESQEYLSYANKPFFKQDDMGFDLRIQYGPVAETSGHNNERFYLSEKVEASETTVDILNGVQLTGMSKQITTADQGAPIQEAYTFLARDLNGISYNHMKRMINGSTPTQLNTVLMNMQDGPIV